MNLLVDLNQMILKHQTKTSSNKIFLCNKLNKKEEMMKKRKKEHLMQKECGNLKKKIFQKLWKQ